MYGKMQETGVIWNFPLDVYLTYLGTSIFKAQNSSCFFFSILNSPQNALFWVTAVANGLILVELEWQVTFFFNTNFILLGLLLSSAAFADWSQKAVHTV